MAHVAEETDVAEAAETVDVVTEAEIMVAETVAAEMADAETVDAETVDAETEAAQITVAMSAANEMADIAEAMTAETEEVLRITNAKRTAEGAKETTAKAAEAANAVMTVERIVEITVEASVAETVTVVAERTVENAKEAEMVDVVESREKTAVIMVVQLLNVRPIPAMKAMAGRRNTRASEPLHPGLGLDPGHQGRIFPDVEAHLRVHSSERSDEKFHLI